jgi:hypothetical protein
MAAISSFVQPWRGAVAATAFARISFAFWRLCCSMSSWLLGAGGGGDGAVRILGCSTTVDMRAAPATLPAADAGSGGQSAATLPSLVMARLMFVVFWGREVLRRRLN